MFEPPILDQLMGVGALLQPLALPEPKQSAIRFL